MQGDAQVRRAEQRCVVRHAQPGRRDRDHFQRVGVFQRGDAGEVVGLQGAFARDDEEEFGEVGVRGGGEGGVGGEGVE